MQVAYLCRICYDWQNHKDVLVVVDHKDYPALLEYLDGKQDDQDFRRMLAWKAFQHVASYDSAVSEWLWKQSNKGISPTFGRYAYSSGYVNIFHIWWYRYLYAGDTFPPSFTVPLSLKSTLRYGENPHQKAAFYGDKSLSLVNAGGIATAIQHHGKVRQSCFVLVAASLKWNTNHCNLLTSISLNWITLHTCFSCSLFFSELNLHQ